MALINNDNKTWTEPAKEEFKTWNIFEKMKAEGVKIFGQTWMDYLKTIEDIENWTTQSHQPLRTVFHLK